MAIALLPAGPKNGKGNHAASSACSLITNSESDEVCYEAIHNRTLISKYLRLLPDDSSSFTGRVDPQDWHP